MLKWIILAFFLATMAWQIMRAITKPMIKNVLTVVSIAIAFVITAILHRNGFFAEVVNKLLVKFEVGEIIISKVGPEWGPKIAEMMPGVISVMSALAAPAVFSFVFNIIFLILKIFYVNFVTKYLEFRNVRREKREFKKALKREKKHVKKIVAATAKTNRALWQEIPEEKQKEIREKYEDIDDDEIERMVDKRVRKEKRRRRKQGYFRESTEHKIVSVFAGVLCGFLLFAINSLAIFYNMDIVCDITHTVLEGGEYEEGDQKTTLYLAIETFDKYVVGSYEDSVVIKIYDELGVIDLLNKTVRAGGNIAGEGEDPIYGSDIAELFASTTLRLACAMLDVNYSDDYIREDTETLLSKNPLAEKMVDTATTALVDYLNENPELLDKYLGSEDEGDMISALLGMIIGAYQDDEGKFITEPFKNDINAATEVVVVISENKLLAKILADDFDKADLLKDKELLGGVISAMSNLTPYRPAMEGAFTMGLGMMTPLLGLPENDAAAYDAFIAQIVSASNDMRDLTEDNLIDLQTLFISAAEYRIYDGKLAYINERIDGIEAQITEKQSLISSNNGRIAEIDLRLAEIAERLDGIENELLDDSVSDEDRVSLENEKTILTDEQSSLTQEKSTLESDNITQATLVADWEEELNNTETGWYKKLADLELQREEYTEKTNILNYILDPLYVIELIRDEGVALRDAGEELKSNGERLQAEGEALQKDGEIKQAEIENKISEINGEIERIRARIEEIAPIIIGLEFKKESEGDLTTYEKAYLDELYAEQEDLSLEISDLETEIVALEEDIASTVENFTERGEALIQEGKNLVAQGEVLADRALDLADSATECVEIFEERIQQFTPFISYYMNWTSVQKPFMLAGEDLTSACLSMNIGGTVYVCNTDFITIETLLDLALGMLGSNNGENTDETPENADPESPDLLNDESVDDEETEDDDGMGGFADFSVDEYLDQIPMKDLFETITITEVTEENKEEFNGRVSPFTNLYNFLIAMSSDNKNQSAPAEMNEEWLRYTLEGFPTNLHSKEMPIEDTSSEMIVILLADRSEFEYKGMTAEDFNNALNFAAWDDAAVKAEDSEKLVDIIFALIDLIGNLNNTETIEEGNSSGVLGESNQLEALFGLFNVLGTTMDLMAETECLKGLPPVMLEAILKNEMLSLVMTPSMLNGYMEEMNSEDFSYATFMQEFVGTFTDLLAKLNTQGGNE